MKPSDSYLLEKAYLSINQKLPSVPSDNITETDEDDEDGVEQPEIDSDFGSGESDDKILHISPAGISSAAETPMSHENETEALHLSDDCCEEEIHDMNVDNLNSIRESISKIACLCAQGGSLEPWQQQKIAIAMDNLAEVARRIR